MNPDFLYHFLRWCGAFNYAVLVAWFIAFVFARKRIRNLHGKWFNFSEPTFDAIHYSSMAVGKVGILLFNVARLQRSISCHLAADNSFPRTCYAHR